MAVGGNIVAKLTTNNRGWNSGMKSAKDMVKDLTRVAVKAGATIGAAMGFRKITEAASDVEETMNKFDVVFGRNAQTVKSWGDTYAREVGRSKNMVADFLSSTQDLFMPIGFDASGAEAISKHLTRLSVDVASFNNKLDADVLRDFHSALTGGGETVKKYGVLLNVATVNQKLLQQSIDPKNATDQQKVMARLAILTEATSAAHGDATRSAGSYANQMKRLHAIGDDLAAGLGGVILPAITSVVTMSNAVIQPLSDWVTQNQRLVESLAKGAVVVAAGYAAFKLVNAALAMYAKRAALAQALSGPAGWTTLAVSVGVAAVAIDQVNASLEATADVSSTLAEANEAVAASNNAVAASADRATASWTAQGKAAREAQASAITSNEQDITKLMDQQRTSAERLSEALAVLNKRRELLRQNRFTGGRKQGGPTVFDIDETRDRLIDSMTGYGSAVRSVQDEIAKLQGKATDASLKLRDLAEAGVPKGKLEALKKQYDQLASLEAERDKQKAATKAADVADRERKKRRASQARERENMNRRAEQIRVSLDTPAEAFQRTVAKINEVVQSGALSRADGLKAIQNEARRRAQEIEGQTPPSVAGEAVESRSAEAYKTIIAAQGRDNHDANIEKLTTELLEQAKLQVQAANNAAKALNDAPTITKVESLDS